LKGGTSVDGCEFYRTERRSDVTRSPLARLTTDGLPHDWRRVSARSHADRSTIHLSADAADYWVKSRKVGRRVPVTDPGFRFERDEQQRRIVITLSEKASVDVWMAAVAAVITQNAWRDPAVFDMSAVEGTALLLNLPNLVPVVAGLTEAHGRRQAVAVIVREAGLSIWRQRLSGLFRDLLFVEAFSDLASAHRWLTQRDEPAPPSRL
jgi:hypothetical protein